MLNEPVRIVAGISTAVVAILAMIAGLGWITADQADAWTKYATVVLGALAAVIPVVGEFIRNRVWSFASVLKLLEQADPQQQSSPASPPDPSVH